MLNLVLKNEDLINTDKYYVRMKCKLVKFPSSCLSFIKNKNEVFLSYMLTIWTDSSEINDF